jgi:hypothetical protein
MEVIIEYQDIFDIEETVESLLDGIGKIRIIELCTFLLSFNTSNSIYKEPDRLLSMWFSIENEDFKNEVLNEISNYKSKVRTKDIVIVNPISSLNLLEFAINNLADETTVSNENFEINIFKAYLLLNQKYNQRDKLVSESIPNDKRNLSTLALTGQYQQYDLINYDLKDLTIAQFIKAYFLFDFMSSYDERTQSILTKFLEFYEVSSWKEYLKMYLPLVFAIISNNRETHIDIVIEKNADFQKSCSFIDKLIFPYENDIEGYDYLGIREKPFVKLKDGEYRIIYSLFVIEKLFQGLYFAFNHINSSTKKSRISSFRGFYAYEYSEKYLVYKLLNLSFPNKFIKLGGQKIKDKGFIGEPDYYVRFKNKVFLFETKDVLINAKIKTSNDYLQLEEALIDKFYYSTDKKGKKHDKAVLQLISNIRYCLKGEYDKFDKGLNPNNATIYPVLIVHYNQYNTPGLNLLIDGFFKSELEKLEEEGFNIRKVKGLTILNIDTLVLYHELFRTRKIRLEELVESYHEQLYPDKSKVRSKKETYKIIENSINPFANYVDNTLFQAKLTIKTPRIFRELGLNLFDNLYPIREST